MLTVIVYYSDGSRERLSFDTYDDAVEFLTFDPQHDVTADLVWPCGSIEEWGVNV